MSSDRPCATTVQITRAERDSRSSGSNPVAPTCSLVNFSTSQQKASPCVGCVLSRPLLLVRELGESWRQFHFTGMPATVLGWTGQILMPPIHREFFSNPRMHEVKSSRSVRSWPTKMPWMVPSGAITSNVG